MKKLLWLVATAWIAIATFSLGTYRGAEQAYNEVKTEVNSWHTARLYEDGSWVVTYKDGTGNVGCIDTGLCQD